MGPFADSRDSYFIVNITYTRLCHVGQENISPMTVAALRGEWSATAAAAAAAMAEREKNRPRDAPNGRAALYYNDATLPPVYHQLPRRSRSFCRRRRRTRVVLCVVYAAPTRKLCDK